MKKYLTGEGLEKLKKELEYLENVKRKEVSERLKQAEVIEKKESNQVQIGFLVSLSSDNGEEKKGRR